MAPTYITITETFEDGQGNPLTGTATFTPTATVYFSGVPLVTAGVPVNAIITSAGLLKNTSGGPLQLLATDSAGQAIEGLTGFWYWTAAWSFTAGGGQSFSFGLPKATPSPVDLLSLVNTSLGGGITLPAGDLGGTNASPTVVGTHLATTFTFGASGAAPASGTFVAGQVLVDQNGVIRVCTAGGTPGTWARAGQRPHEFYVDDYGAKGDGKVFLGGGGTVSTATFTDSTNSPFVSGDTGKVIVVNQGSNGGNVTAALTTTITYVSASSVTLGANWAATTANCPYVYGTDDAAAITNCVNAAAAYASTATGATPSNPNVDIIFSSKNYMLAGLTQSKTGVSGAVQTFNAHIPVPSSLITAQRLVISFRGASGTGSAPGPQFWESTIPSLEGTSLISAITPPAQPDANFGQMSILGAATNGDATHFLSGFSNVQVNLFGITLVAPWLSQITGLNGYNAASMSVTDARAMSFMPVNLQAAAIGGPWMGNLSNTQLAANDVAAGFRFPTSGNNANAFASRITVAGFSVGVQAGEHMNAQELTLLYADRGYVIDMSGFGPTTHGHTLVKPTIEVCNHGIMVLNGGAGQSVPVFVADLDMENIFADHISDPTNSLNGFVYVSNTSATRPVTNGASQLMVIDILKHSPGPWSGAPAAPSSGTANAQQNLAYRYATVYASATTSITNTSVGSSAGAGQTALGQAGGANVAVPIRVPPGWFYSVTYTGTLTTVWVLD